MQGGSIPAKAGLKEYAGLVARAWLATAVLIVAAVLVACSDENPVEPLPGQKPIASVSISPKSGVWTGTLRVGQSIELAARPLASDGTELPPAPVTWETTDDDVLTVDLSGTIVAIAEGMAEVRASIGDRTGTTQVVVTADPSPDPVVASVQVSPTGAVLEIGQTRQYTARAFNAGGTELFGRTVTWSTISPTVVSVSGTGLVRALGAGYGEVIATIDGRSAHVGVTVPTPEPVRAVIVTPSSVAVFATQYAELRAIVIGPNGGTLPNRAVTWTSENPEIAQVGAEGMVLGVAKGTARIRATSEGVTGFATVEVRLLPTGPVQTYDLLGTQSLPVPYIEIGRTQWTDPSGNVREVFHVVSGGTLVLDTQAGSWRQDLKVDAYIVEGGPNQLPVDTRRVSDDGPLLYDFTTGLPILQSVNTPGLFLRASFHGAGEYLIPQSVLGTPSQQWVWVIR